MTDSIHENLTGKDAALARVQELTWALLDQQISSDEIALLDKLLVSCNEARQTYIECVQLHAELAGHFAREAEAPQPAATSSPILGFLNASNLPIELPVSPITEAQS